jgi:hypothetical protein
VEIPVTSAGEENIPLIPESLVLVPSGMHTNSVISHFVTWTSLSPISYCNGFQRTQNKLTSSCWYNKGHNIQNPRGT